MRAIAAIPMIVCLSFAALAGDPPRMSLSNRVEQATLVVVGKLAGPYTMGHACTVWFAVDETLFGSVPTNRTLRIDFRLSSLLIPEIASKTGPAPRGSRWIVFLTDQGLEQTEKTIYRTRAVGPYGYAHDGFELANDGTIKQVRGLIEWKKRNRSPTE